MRVVPIECQNLWPFSANTGQRRLSNQSLAMPCFVHPDGETLHVDPSGALCTSEPWRDLLFLPLAIMCGGILSPAALTHAMTVKVSRLPLVLAWRNLVPFCARTQRGLCSSWTLVSSMFHTCSGLSASPVFISKLSRALKYFSTLMWFMYICWTAAVGSGLRRHM